jgi:hypothetical protein
MAEPDSPTADAGKPPWFQAGTIGPARLRSRWVAMRMYAAITVIVSALFTITSGQGAESDFYQTLLTTVPTNDLRRPVAVRSPLLVDTNNIAPKLTADIELVRAMSERGVVSGISLGMTMSEVVSRLGKPPRLWTICGAAGGPLFAYSDISLVFRSDELWEVHIPKPSSVMNPTPKTKVEELGPPTGSTLEAWISALGQPTRHVDRNSDVAYAVYESPEHALIVAYEIESHNVRYLNLQKREAGGFRIH